MKATDPSVIRFLEPLEVRARYAAGAVRTGASIDGPLLRAERLHYYGSVNDPVELAASILLAVNREHPLHDGNKRLSISLCDEFLALNNRRINGDDHALADLVWAIAREAATLSDSDVADRVRPFVHDGAAQAPFAERHPATMHDLAHGDGKEGPDVAVHA